MGTTTATRSVVVGLLLAALVAGSLISFSLVARRTNDPTGATITASRPDGDVPAVVLGTRIGEDESSTTVLEPIPSIELEPAPAASPGLAAAPPPAGDEVLGQRFRNDGGDDRLKARDARTKSRDPRKGDDKRKSNDKRGKQRDEPKAAGAPTAARTSSSCDCKSRREHTPNGHAYGYHKERSSSGSQGLARGHDKANENSQGKAKGKTKKK
ncbi:MAG: hypothetical protein KY391_00145 [Actinobacteria bacterium]|nr:hypothetical protein [Actinomycetota bacterium]